MERYLSENGEENSGFSASAQSFFEMSQDWYRDRMDVGWEPPTASQAMQIWERHGFTGPFWEV